MMYIGIGNAGCKLLWAFRQVLDLATGHPPALANDCFAIADSDPNNGILHHARQQTGHIPDPLRVRVFDIDRYWNGGCGVYHIIGEMVVDIAHVQGATLDLTANYFKPVWNARLEAVARVTRRTRTLGFIECEVCDESGSMVAKVFSTCMVLRGKEAAGR